VKLQNPNFCTAVQKLGFRGGTDPPRDRPLQAESGGRATAYSTLSKSRAKKPRRRPTKGDGVYAGVYDGKD